jgi:hypothetical protein
MWKVSNNLNSEILLTFRDEISTKLFIEFINFKITEFGNSSFIEYLNSDSIIFEAKRDLYIYIANKRKNIRFNDLVENFVDQPIPQITIQFIEYLAQNRKLDNLNFNVTPFNVDPNLYIIFSKFYYELFFNDPNIWHKIGIKEFNRSVFHNNFKSENKIEVCPYCDIDTIISRGNQLIEHFLPRKNYAFLAMHPLNLISSCYSCNGPHGKQINYYHPITSPFNYQIGDMVEFEIDNENKLINIKKSSITGVENFISLLKLREKYSSKSVFNVVDSKIRNTFKIFYDLESMLKSQLETSELYKKYLNYKKEPLTFATKSVISDINQYEKYRLSRIN